MERWTFYAPAKVNLCLHVQARRPDGYHDLCMIMQKVSLADELELSVGPGRGVVLRNDQVSLAPGEENIVVRAARKILERLDDPVRVEIRLTKQIPDAEGLGGGSSDAATVLRALNDWLPDPCTEQELHHLALQLGADVPFFLQDQTVWASGVGDKFTPVTIDADYVLLLVNPGVPVSTADVYRGLAVTDFSPRETVARIDGIEALCHCLHNDLERVAISMQPVIKMVKQAVAAQGASGVLMSGSGATVFGVFSSRCQAEKAAECLVQEHHWWCKVVSPL